MTTKLSLTSSVLVASLVTLASSALAQTFFGDAVSVGDGWVRTYVTYQAGAPGRLGVQMNNTAFSAFASLDEQALILSLPGQAPAPSTT